MLATYGISMNQFDEFIDVSFGGEKLSEIYEGQRRFDLVLRLNKDYTESIEGIRASLIEYLRWQKSAAGTGCRYCIR